MFADVFELLFALFIGLFGSPTPQAKLMSTTAVTAAAATTKVPNMPAGWAWPPSARMLDDGERCLARLDALGVSWQRGEATQKVATPIVVPSMSLRGLQLRSRWRSGPFVMDCHLALALATAAPELRALGVEALRFSGIHVYRPVIKNGKPTNILSRHAIGLAIDVPAIAFEDGSELRIADFYATRPELRRVEAALDRTGMFRKVLSPGNDPKGHGDHFHLEAHMPARKR